MHLQTARPRLVLVTAFVAFAIALLSALSAFAEGSQTLFFIQRSKNANEVHYAVRLTKDGALVNPVPLAAGEPAK